MVETRPEIVELTRATRGTDLFSVIEAAQYARVVEHEESEAGPDAAAADAFLARFTDCAEAWESKTPAEQAASLVRLGEDLEALARVGLFVYWAAPERDFVRDAGEPHCMPLAIIKVTRQSDGPVTLRLPSVVRV